MSILVDDNKIFTINTDNSTYQIMADPLGYLLHLYYGRRTEGVTDYLLSFADRGFSGNPYDAGRDRTYSLDVLPQEFPHRGTGDYRNTAFIAEYPDGSRKSDLIYDSYAVRKGKYSLPGLPAVFASEDEAETLEIVLKDKWSGLEVMLYYGVIPSLDIITRSAVVRNSTEGTIRIKKISSCCLDFVSGDYDLVSFCGRHCMERQPERQRIAHGTLSVGSVRGASSHQYNPMLIIADNETGEDHGTCFSMSFVYSGSFMAEAERDQFNQTRVLMGL